MVYKRVLLKLLSICLNKQSQYFKLYIVKDYFNDTITGKKYYNRLKPEFAVEPTDKNCGRSLSSDHSGYCVNRMININPR